MKKGDRRKIEKVNSGREGHRENKGEGEEKEGERREINREYMREREKWQKRKKKN